MWEQEKISHCRLFGTAKFSARAWTPEWSATPWVQWEVDSTPVEQRRKMPSHRAWGEFLARQSFPPRRHEALTETEHQRRQSAGCSCTPGRGQQLTCERAGTTCTQYVEQSATSVNMQLTARLFDVDHIPHSMLRWLTTGSELAFGSGQVLGTSAGASTQMKTGLVRGQHCWPSAGSQHRNWKGTQY